jgi:uncharacterized protein
MAPLECVKTIYAAFARGDIAAILAVVSPDVDWEYAGNWEDIPWLRRRRGHAGVIDFFTELAASMQIEHFAPTTFLEGPGVVAALVDIRFVVTATGKRVEEQDEIHLWHFDEAGRVSKFRHRIDTRLQGLACQ